MKRILALFCLLCLFMSQFGFSVVAYSNPAASTPKNVSWYTVDAVLSVERQTDTFLVHAAAGDYLLDFYISFPVEGGFHIRLSNRKERSGFFNPSALQKIRYLTISNTRTVMCGTDNTMLTFEKNTDGFSLAVGGKYRSDAVSFSSDCMEFGFLNGKVEKFRMTLPLRNDEAIYNGSERFNAVNQVGQTFSLRNEDCWSDDPASYINVPIFHSSNGYSIWYNMTYTASADVGVSNTSAYSVEFEGGKVDFYMWGGSILENIKKYTAITGTSIIPPKWAFGYWLGAQAVPWRTDSNGTVQADGSEAARKVCYQNLVDMFEGYEKMGITDFAAVYGEGMNSTMMPESYEYVKSRNSRMLMWYTPRGYSTTSHMPTLLPGYARESWPLPLKRSNPLSGNFLGSFIDFTHPNAKAAITSFFNGGTSITHGMKYWDAGLKGAMIDYGEWLDENTLCYNGLGGDEMHNFISYYFAKEQKQAWDAYYPDGDYILFERSGCAGSQAFVANFTGDQHGDWEGLGDQVSGILSMSMGGFNIVGGDMGGFGKNCTEELYMRWVQFSAFSPLMRLHGQELRTPWGKGENAYEMFPTYYWVRQNMQDTLYSAAIDANLNATPMVQPLGVAYQGQNDVDTVEDQYIFCNTMMVCPVITKGATSRTVLFPEGDWYNLWTHQRTDGGVEKVVSAPVDTMPVYLKSGAVMPVDLPDSLQLAESMQNVTKYKSLLITPPDMYTSTPVYDSADAVTTYASRYVNANTFTVVADKKSERRAVVLYGTDAVDVSVDGSSLSALSTMPNMESDAYGYYTNHENVTYVFLPSGWENLTVKHVDSVFPFTSSANGLLGYNTTKPSAYPNGYSYANYSTSSKDLQEEFLEYMTARYDYYYTDYNNGSYIYRKVPFVGNENGTAWSFNAIFANRFMQFSIGMDNLQSAEMRQIAALVPKGTDGNPLKLKNFNASYGLRFERDYGSVVFAFRQGSCAGFFTKSGESNDQTYLKISCEGVELYDRGTRKTLHTFNDITPIAQTKVQNFKVSLSVIGDEMTYSIREERGVLGTIRGTVKISDSKAGYISLAMVGAYNGLELLSVTEPDLKSNGMPSVQIGERIEGGSLNITAVSDTPNAEGYYQFRVEVIPDKGYQLRAGSLLAVDTKGNMQLPENIDYRKNGSGNVFVLYAKNGTDIFAEFYKPKENTPNVALIGTSFHQSECGLRFVYRLYRKIENGKTYVLLDGVWRKVSDYGILIAAEQFVGSQRFDVTLAEQNLHIKKISVLSAGKYFDVADEYVDMSVQVVGLDRVIGGKEINLATNAYIQLSDGSYIYANSYADNFIRAGGKG